MHTFYAFIVSVVV